MKVADWVALGIVTAGTVIGGVLLFRKLDAAAPLAANAPTNSQLTVPNPQQPAGARVLPGATVPQPDRVDDTRTNVDNTGRDIKTAVEVGKTVVSIAKDLYAFFGDESSDTTSLDSGANPTWSF